MDENQGSEEREPRRRAAMPLGAVIGVAVAVGTSMGVALHNVAAGLGIGLAIGVGMMLLAEWGERSPRRRR